MDPLTLVPLNVIGLTGLPVTGTPLACAGDIFSDNLLDAVTVVSEANGLVKRETEQSTNNLHTNLGAVTDEVGQHFKVECTDEGCDEYILPESGIANGNSTSDVSLPFKEEIKTENEHFNCSVLPVECCVDINTSYNTKCYSELSLTKQGQSEQPKDSETYCPMSDLEFGACNESYTCELCHRGVPNKESLVYISRLRKNVCNECEIVKVCVRLKCRELAYICDKCPNSYNSQHYLDIHKMIHSDEKPYCCEVCDEKFYYIDSLNKHKNQHTVEKKTGESEPLKRITAIGNSNVTNAEGTGAVSYSNVKFQLLSAVNEGTDKRLRACDKQYKCSVCQKGFIFKNICDIHMTMHAGEGKDLLSASQVRSFSNTELVSNKHKQTNQKSYSCDICDNTFFTRQLLRHHRSIHAHRYECDTCKSTFKLKRDLKAHRWNKHSENYRHSCDECGKKFSDKKRFEAHKRLHTGEKPYSCDICQKKFICSSYLNRHKTCHESESRAFNMYQEILKQGKFLCFTLQ